MNKLHRLAAELFKRRSSHGLPPTPASDEPLTYLVCWGPKGRGYVVRVMQGCECVDTLYDSLGISRYQSTTEFFYLKHAVDAAVRDKKYREERAVEQARANKIVKYLGENPIPEPDKENSDG